MSASARNVALLNKYHHKKTSVMRVQMTRQNDTVNFCTENKLLSVTCLHFFALFVVFSFPPFSAPRVTKSCARRTEIFERSNLRSLFGNKTRVTGADPRPELTAFSISSRGGRDRLDQVLGSPLSCDVHLNCRTRCCVLLTLSLDTPRHPSRDTLT